MKLFGKKKDVEKVIPENETGIEPGAMYWFIHTLIEDVGHVEWVRMTAEEQAKYDEERPYNKGYPFKVVKHPIPKGKDIVLKGSDTRKINCDSEETRNMIIEMARQYNELESQNRYLRNERKAGEWLPISELKPILPCMSIRGPRIFLVTSPELCYVNGGVALGTEHEGKWYVFLRGKKIEHTPTFYRHLPPHPFLLNPNPYEQIKDEVERLRKAIDDSGER